MKRRTSLPWLLAFAAIATILLLTLGNEAVELAERLGLVDTHRPGEAIQSVDEPLFEEQGQWYRTSTYGAGSLVPARFARTKGERWRMFVLGGSFAMGSPYVNGEQPRHGDEGGIPSWLQGTLSARFPDHVEVVNAAAGGQDSRRVVEIAREVLDLDPDLLLIAMGNNEGNLGAGLVRTQLRSLGGYRLLRRVLLRHEQTGRSWFTPQDADSSQLRLGFQERIHALLEEATRREVPVLLATMPINLSYLGFEPGKIIQGSDWPPLGGACRDGIRAFEAQRFQDALPQLHTCLVGPDSQQPPPLASYVALAQLETGVGDGEAALAVLSASQGACIGRGIGHYYRGEYARAITELEGCDEVAEALTWLGRSWRKSGEVEKARHALYQSVELVPRNRTRPSLNDIIRAEAALFDGAHLVDLEAAAEELARGLGGDGIPGPEQFLDYCHMGWWGYAAMADAVLRVIERERLGPQGMQPLAAPSREDLRALFRLEQRAAPGRD